jgi:hypothetical protein
LLKGYLNFFDCGYNTESIAREIAKWDSADLEAALTKAGLPACRTFGRKHIEHGDSEALRNASKK